MRTALAVVALVALAGGEACSRKAEYSGIGPWNVKKTRLRDATGRCEPTDLPDGRKGTWCFGQPGLRLGGQDASVDLYFGGTEPDARVIELQLQFRGCREEPLTAWLEKTFGAPYERRGTRAFWKNGSVYVVGALPESPGRCSIRMLPRSEEAELERLRAQAEPRPVPATPPAPAAPTTPPPAPTATPPAATPPSPP